MTDSQDPFVYPTNEFSPPLVSSFALSLTHVSRSDTVISRKQVVGPFLPDPKALRSTSASALNIVLYSKNWLRIRQRFLNALQDQPYLQALPTQFWRNTLSLDDAQMTECLHAGQSSRDRSVSGQRQSVSSKTQKRREKAMSIIRSLPFHPSDPEGLTWHEFHVDPQATELSPQFLKPVIWELQELNFRLELLALDRDLVTRRSMPLGQAILNDQLVLSVFPNKSLWFDRLPKSDLGAGLGAAAKKTRAPYLEALRRVVLRWPLCPPALAQNGFIAGMADPIHESLERKIWDYYSQTFYTQFGRAPCVLSIFPHEDVEALRKDPALIYADTATSVQQSAANSASL